jgi:hypothetical protein
MRAPTKAGMRSVRSAAPAGLSATEIGFLTQLRKLDSEGIRVLQCVLDSISQTSDTRPALCLIQGGQS